MNIMSPIRSLLAALLLVGCDKNPAIDPNSQSKMVFGSPEWNKAAAEDISVRVVSVLRQPGKELSWQNEGRVFSLTQEEQEAIKKSVTGQLQVVYTTGRGSGSREVRVVIIMSGPLKENARLPFPETGSYIYLQEGGALKPLLTNSPPSALTLEIYQEKTNTVFFMDYPRDRVRSGGAIFFWDENGRFHEI